MKLRMPTFGELCELIVWFVFVYSLYGLFICNNALAIFTGVVSCVGLIVIQWINH